jgi:hypothetical protein
LALKRKFERERKRIKFITQPLYLYKNNFKSLWNSLLKISYNLLKATNLLAFKAPKRKTPNQTMIGVKAQN